MEKDILKSQFMRIVESSDFVQVMEKKFEKALGSGCVDIESANEATVVNIFTAALLDMASGLKSRNPKNQREVSNIQKFI